MAEHPPLSVLPNEYLPHLKEGARAPRFLFGWVFNHDWTLELARRRGLTFDVQPYFRRYLGGSETFNFADVTEDHLKLPMLQRHLRAKAFQCVCKYVRLETHAQFVIREPVSDKWDSMFVLWTNYDLRESYQRFQLTATWWKVKEFMDEAMNEGLPAGSDRSESLWWWAVSGNTLVCSKSTVSSIKVPLTGMTYSIFKANVASLSLSLCTATRDPYTECIYTSASSRTTVILFLPIVHASRRAIY